ncbi:MAG: PIN domain-containing protein [Spirochaetes bacterium]|jgi:hypothetical protein|nr:PIN domain-containing protein [Spirochaetota bacterium]
MKSTIVDAGPLIALFDKDDFYHKQVIAFFKGYSGRLISTWPVITETSHMLSFNSHVQIDFLNWLNRGAVEIIDFGSEKIDRLIELFEKYSDVPIDLADGSLLVVSEITGIRDILTIDSDYHIYRLKNRKSLINLLDPYLEKKS